MNGGVFMYDAPGKCPVCDNNLSVAVLKCNRCKTELSGSFKLSKFCQLDDEMKEFVEVFIKCRGNIKEVERELGISYPTVRSRLDKAIEALGYKVEDESTSEKISEARQDILKKLSEGKISAEEATKLIKQLG